MTTIIDYKTAESADDLVVGLSKDKSMAFVYHKDCQNEGGVFGIENSMLDTLSEEEIIDRFNAHVESIRDGIENDRPIEIRDGKPQLNWNEMCQQWSAAGDVLRCVVSWNRNGSGEHGLGQLAVCVDDKILSGNELLKIIESYEGWGVRIEFMHPNRLTNPPEPIVQDKGR